MWKTVSEAYAACEVGQTASVRPANDGEDTLRRFQTEVEAAARFQREGKIRIVMDHKERETGSDFTDLIMIERIA
ncbi:hypothetical protein DBB29_24610 [Pandoraea cepalis]|uniref:Uncharacterized protein n=1 Tax=Pandoraea cepalis TaxID=2508294 RepID=A0AAW7MGE7_9BURK|nr:hypothetical protein [Pandoraea cepalis]MDN4571844.1 hypothetical protein [Pandoraea cepalis]MDN4581298.1 hypothetical protein [Pandoraea cepalis]